MVASSTVCFLTGSSRVLRVFAIACGLALPNSTGLAQNPRETATTEATVTPTELPAQPPMPPPSDTPRRPAVAPSPMPQTDQRSGSRALRARPISPGPIARTFRALPLKRPVINLLRQVQARRSGQVLPGDPPSPRADAAIPRAAEPMMPVAQPAFSPQPAPAVETTIELDDSWASRPAPAPVVIDPQPTRATAEKMPETNREATTSSNAATAPTLQSPASQEIASPSATPPAPLTTPTATPEWQQAAVRAAVLVEFGPIVGSINSVQYRVLDPDTGQPTGMWTTARTGESVFGRIEVRTGLGVAASVTLDRDTRVQIERLSRVRFERHTSVEGDTAPSVELTRGGMVIEPLAVDSSGLALSPVRVRTPDSTSTTRGLLSVNFDALTGTSRRVLAEVPTLGDDIGLR